MQKAKHLTPRLLDNSFPTTYPINKYKQNKTNKQIREKGPLTGSFGPVYLSQDGTPVVGVGLLGQQKQQLLAGGLGHGLGVGGVETDTLSSGQRSCLLHWEVE